MDQLSLLKTCYFFFIPACVPTVIFENKYSDQYLAGNLQTEECDVVSGTVSNFWLTTTFYNGVGFILEYCETLNIEGFHIRNTNNALHQDR